jgi:hypothetical protein
MSDPKLVSATPMASEYVFTQLYAEIGDILCGDGSWELFVDFDMQHARHFQLPIEETKRHSVM